MEENVIKFFYRMFFFEVYRRSFFLVMFFIFILSACHTTVLQDGRRTGVKVTNNGNVTIISENTNSHYAKTYKINGNTNLFDKIISFNNGDINLNLFLESENCSLNRQVLIENINRLFPNKVFFEDQKFIVNFYLIYQKNFLIIETKHLEEPLNFYFTIEQCDPQQTFDQLLSFVATLYHELTHLSQNNSSISRYEEYIASKNALCANLLTKNNVYMNFDTLKPYRNAQDAFENNSVYKNIYKRNDKLSILGNLDAHYELFTLVGENFSTQSAEQETKINKYCNFN